MSGRCEMIVLRRMRSLAAVLVVLVGGWVAFGQEAAPGAGDE